MKHENSIYFLSPRINDFNPHLRSSLSLFKLNLFRVSRLLSIPIYSRSYWFNRPILSIEIMDRSLNMIGRYRGSSILILADQGGRIINLRLLRFVHLLYRRGFNLILMGGLLHGFDHRISALYSNLKLSLGNFTLSNGNPLFLIIVDFIDRSIYSRDNRKVYLEGGIDSWGRPPVYKSLEVPKWIRSGNHGEIKSKVNLDIVSNEEVNNSRVSH